MNDKDADKMVKEILARLGAELYTTITGSYAGPVDAMLHFVDGRLERVPVDVVERCPRCGPVWLCSKHWNRGIT